ncbi:MAG: hypothetical protein E7036_09685 [Opitutales bacterium]|nr:hypothetical protein [Opitutales bacterium]
MANNSNYSILSGSADKGKTSLSIDVPYPVENNNFIVWLILPTGNVVQGSGSYNNGRISITNNIDTSDEWGAIVYRAETAELNATLKSSGEVSLSDIIAQFRKNVRVLEQLETLVKTSVRAVDEIVPLPNATKRAGKFLSFDKNGNPVCEVNVDTFESNKASAEQSAKSASASATDASKYCTSASGYATSASASATDASKYCTSASGYATSASASATSASKSASNASTSETNALSYCTSASTSATSASTSAINASTSEKNAKESALKAESYSNLSSIYKNAVMRMMKGEDSVCELRFKTEDNKLVLVKAEIVDGVPMLIPSIATTGTTQTAISVLRWETANGEMFDVFAEIIDGVPVLSCAK